MIYLLSCTSSLFQSTVPQNTYNHDWLIQPNSRAVIKIHPFYKTFSLVNVFLLQGAPRLCVFLDYFWVQTNEPLLWTLSYLILYCTPRPPRATLYCVNIPTLHQNLHGISLINERVHKYRMWFCTGNRSSRYLLTPISRYLHPQYLHHLQPSSSKGIKERKRNNKMVWGILLLIFRGFLGLKRRVG